jgi:hypothetical protein
MTKIGEAVKSAEFVLPPEVVEYGKKIGEMTKDHSYGRDARLSKEEETIRTLYRAHEKGLPLIDVRQAILNGGLVRGNWPKLAFVPMNTYLCLVRRSARKAVFGFMDSDNSGHGADRWWRTWLEVDGFDNSTFFGTKTAESTRPSVPLELRNEIKVSDRFMLYEADWRRIDTEPDRISPVDLDPFILVHVEGPIFAIEATFDLTKAEVEALAFSRKVRL